MALLVRGLVLFRTVWAVVLALLVGSILIAAVGVDPLAAYGALFGGAFFDYWGFASTLVKTSPILLAGLAVVVPLRAGLFNIGGEGQIYLGALTATAAALYLPELPGPIHIAVCALAGMAGGAL
jgi:simple sugar transport system permease protein